MSHPHFNPKAMPTFEGAPNWGTEQILAAWGQHGWDLAEALVSKLTPEQLSEIDFDPRADIPARVKRSLGLENFISPNGFN